jgi:glycolate oxidase
MVSGAHALAVELARILEPDQVLSGPAVEKAYECDAYTVDRSPPFAVVLPRSTEDVCRIVDWCSRSGVPFTPRGAGTGLSGGAMAAKGGIVVSTKKMTQILEVDPVNRRLRAQAGATNASLSAAASRYGLHFAPDPSSQTVSTLGGNIAENSGGPHTLKYGVTAQHVLQVTIVCSDGRAYQVGNLVEGDPGPDVLALIVGSEGVLGLVTEAWVKLTPTPDVVETLLASFRSVRDATEAVAEIVSRGTLPAALEFIDGRMLFALHQAFGLRFPEGTEAMLLIECDGHEAERVQKEAEECVSVCSRRSAILIERAESPEDRARLWTVRKKGIGAMGRLAPAIVTHDGVIPRSKLPEMLDFVYEVAARHGLSVANLFHAGDGNLHPCFYFDDREPGVVGRVVAAGEEILARCVELGGSVSGEHGIGLEKLDGLKLMFSEDDLRLQRDVREVFAASELCNPCKVIPDQRGCVEHMRRWRGAAS